MSGQEAEERGSWLRYGERWRLRIRRARMMAAASVRYLFINIKLLSQVVSFINSSLFIILTLDH